MFKENMQAPVTAFDFIYFWKLLKLNKVYYF